MSARLLARVRALILDAEYMVANYAALGRAAEVRAWGARYERLRRIEDYLEARLAR